MTKILMKTPITYYGGKQKMLPHILPLIPQHTLYTEAFAGGAAVLFAKEPAIVEVINDLNGELINFYRSVVSDFDAVKNRVDETLHSRSQHDHAWYVYNHPEFFGNAERAWAVWVLSKTGFSGQLCKAFGVDKLRNGSTRRIAFSKENFTADLRSRLQHTTIECNDALAVITRYDIPYAFHFVDPPYVGSDCGHYSGMFNEQNLRELLELLSKIKGKFMLTMFPNADIQRFVDKCGWTINVIERQITAGRSVASRRKQEEWLVMNYKIERK